MQNIGTSNETLTPALDDLIYAKDVSQNSEHAILRKLTLRALQRFLSPVVISRPLTATPGTNETTGERAIFYVPAEWDGMVVDSVHIELATAGITGTGDYDVEINGTSIFTTKITIDSTETGSDTAATPAVIDTTANILATGDILSIDCDAIASGTAGKGAVATLVLRHAAS